MRRRSHALTIVAGILLILICGVGARAQELQWARQLGSPSVDSGNAIAVEHTGVYVAGYTQDTLPGQTSAGYNDAFVCKYDADGTQLWCRQFGTGGWDAANGVATDGTGVYVAGATSGAFPGQTSVGGQDAFICRYDVGGDPVWCRQFGSGADTGANGVATDDSGVYVAGYTSGALPGETSVGWGGVFVCKYDVAGNRLWCRQFGGGAMELAFNVAADGTGVYVVGYTAGALPGQTNSGDQDAFVCKYDTDGTQLWCRQFGSSAEDRAWGVAPDGTGVYVAGTTYGALPGQTSAGNQDAFVCRYDEDGNGIWCRQIGTSVWDIASRVATYGTGVYVAGTTYGALPGQTSAGNQDAFVCRYDEDGNGIWCRQIGSGALDNASSISTNGSGVYEVGITYGAFPGQTNAGSADAFVLKLSIPLASDAVGVFRPSDGTFYLDYNASGQWDGCGTDRCLQIGLNGDIPLVGDWNGSGTSKVGAFRPSDGTFYLDYNGSGTWEGCAVDRCLQIGMNGDIPLVGDWNGSGTTKVGAFRPTDGTFYLDYNGSGTWEGCGTDRCLQIGMLNDTPLVGDWNGTGTSKVGAFRPSDGTFYLDYNGSGTWDGCGTDRCLQIGMLDDTPLVGDWNGSGTAKVGVFRPSDGTFYLDYNGSGTWEGCGIDQCLQVGMLNDIPLVGDWNGSGTAKVGVFRPSDGTFYLDYNGSGTWDGCGTDRCLQIGMNGDAPLVGKW